MKPQLRLAFAFGLGLAACGPLVQIGGHSKPPAALLTLTASATPRPYAGPTPITATIGVEVPAAPAMLQTLRLPVTTSDTGIAYLVGADWAEQPNQLFQRLLVDTIAAGGTAVVDLRQSNIPPARLLSGTLRSFGLDVRDAGHPQVRIRYDAQLSGPRGATGLGIRRFEAAEPVSSQAPAAVAAALNRAANRVAADVATWVAG